MIARIWRAWLNPARLEAYQHFEEAQYLPMLRRQPGFLGGLSLRETADRAVSLTLWEDSGAVGALESAGLHRLSPHSGAKSVEPLAVPLTY